MTILKTRIIRRSLDPRRKLGWYKKRMISKKVTWGENRTIVFKGVSNSRQHCRQSKTRQVFGADPKVAIANMQNVIYRRIIYSNIHQKARKAPSSKAPSSKAPSSKAPSSKESGECHRSSECTI